MFSHILDGHTSAQIQGVALELPGVAPSGISETELDLSQTITPRAKHTLNGQHDVHWFGTYRDAMETAFHGSL
jgi:hypothetical protein